MAREAIKADFIRSQPRDLPLEELQRLAQAAKIDGLGKSYVDKIRRTMPKRKVKAAARAAPETNGHANGHAVEHTSTFTEAPAEVRAFVHAAIVLGTQRARQLLDAIERGIKSS